MGSLAKISSGFRRVPVQVPEGSGFRCRYLVRFWRVQVLEGSWVSVQVAGEVPEGSCADTVLRFWRVPVQIPGEVLEGPGVDTWGGFRVSMQIAGQVAQGSGAGTR